MGVDSAHKQLHALVKALDKRDHKTRLLKQFAGDSSISSHKWSSLSPMIDSLVELMKKPKWEPCPEFLTSLGDLAESHMLEELFLNDSLLDIQANCGLYVPTIQLLCLIIESPSMRGPIFTDSLNERILHIRRLYNEQAKSKIGKALQDSSDLQGSFGRLWALMDAPQADRFSSTRPTLPTDLQESSTLTAPRSSRSKSKSTTLLKGLFFGRKKSKGPETSDSTSSNTLPSEPPATELAAVETEVDPPQAPPTDSSLSPFALELLGLQFGEAELQSTHFYAARDPCKSSKTIKRISHELVSLAKNLPLHPNGSIFVRYDPERIDLLRALVTGPEGTPYEHGCLIFDIYVPQKFPEVPPKVKFVTGATAKVRFNPNLYDSGHVCLSLLGTWTGSQTEKWSSQSSTLLQVLVSIQALILCPSPYFNEPGYEKGRQDPLYIQKSEKYDLVVRSYTLQYGIQQWLTYAPFTDFDRISRIYLQHTRPKALVLPENFNFATDILRP